MTSSGLRLLGFIRIEGRLRPEFVLLLLLLISLAVFHAPPLQGQTNAQVTPPAAGGRIIHGVVKSGNMPIPGAEVSAAVTGTKDRAADDTAGQDTAGSDKVQVNTWTDVDGSYRLRIPGRRPLYACRCRWQRLPRARRK